MDDYAREMMELKALVTRTLEKKGVLANKCLLSSLLSLSHHHLYSLDLVGEVFHVGVRARPTLSFHRFISFGGRFIRVGIAVAELSSFCHLITDFHQIFECRGACEAYGLDSIKKLCRVLGVIPSSRFNVFILVGAELRASVFEAIEEEDRAPENEDNIPPALLGSCNDWAKQLHTTPSGRLLTALVSEYLEWGQLGHALKVYLPECNLPKDFWKDELRNFNTRTNKNGESCPLLLDVLEGYLKYENLTQNRLAGGRLLDPDNDSSSNLEVRNVRRSSSSAASGGLPALSRPVARNQSSDRKSNSSIPMSRKVDYAWKYNVDEVSEDVIRAANALENIQLDRKARNMTTTWRHTSDEKMDDSKVDRR